MRDRYRKSALIKHPAGAGNSASEWCYYGKHHGQSLCHHGAIYPIVDLDLAMSGVILTLEGYVGGILWKVSQRK